MIMMVENMLFLTKMRGYLRQWEERGDLMVNCENGKYRDNWGMMEMEVVGMDFGV